MDQLIKYQNIAKQKGGILLSTSITNRKLKWQCNEGHIFWLTTNKVNRRGQWCKICGNSIGERAIRSILKEFGIPFVQEYKIPMLPHRRYDFNFEYNHRYFLIEFDGEQHFNYVRKYHKTKSKFTESQIIDRIKTYAAWKSNMTIIRIDYTQKHPDAIKYHILNGINGSNQVYFSNPILYTYITQIGITQEQLNHYFNTQPPPYVPNNYNFIHNKTILERELDSSIPKSPHSLYLKIIPNFDQCH